MKIGTKVKLFSVLISLLICASYSTKLNRGEDGKNADAVTYFDGRKETGLNFSLGSNGGYTLNNENDFKKVLTVDALRPYQPIPKGNLESADEVPSNKDYYDGEISLNTVKINCRMYKSPGDCVHQNQCGWCHWNNTCILGNGLGPMEDCPKSKYQFSYPDNVTIPKRITNLDVGSLNIRTYQRTG